MKDMKRLGFPILIICVAAFLTKVIECYFLEDAVYQILSIMTVALLFMFGISLNKDRKKKNKSIIRKAVASLIVTLLMFMQLGNFELPYVSSWFVFLGIKSFYINMLYIFCGYLFVD